MRWGIEGEHDYVSVPVMSPNINLMITKVLLVYIHTFSISLSSPLSLYLYLSLSHTGTLTYIRTFVPFVQIENGGLFHSRNKRYQILY